MTEDHDQWTACIARTAAGKGHLNWCGRHVLLRVRFVSIDHAAEYEGRLVPCRDCVTCINDALRKG